MHDRSLSLARRRCVLRSLIFAPFIAARWHLATRGTGAVAQMDPEYAKLMGATATQGKSAMPGPLDVGAKLWEHLRRPVLRQRPERQGHRHPARLFDRARRCSAICSPSLVAIPLGFLIGMSPLMSRALDPFIQVLKPISPLAWMPLALYTIKDSSLSSIFVIFICSLWPMLINTAFGVAAVRKEWLNVARTLEVGTFRRAFTIILPAAAPTILTGMRISIGIAWLVIVAAEMLVGGTGIGYFVWNEWNNLSITNVITAILLIGLVGMLLDQLLARADAARDVSGVSRWPSKFISHRRHRASASRRRAAAPPRCSRTSGCRCSAASSPASSAIPAAARPPCSTSWPASTQPTDGAVIVDNQAIEGPSLDRAVIFQSHALLPWLTVMGNVAYAVSSKWRNWNGAAGARAGAEVHRPRRPHRRRAQAPGRALRRHEAARRHRARALDRAEDHADGRAVLARSTRSPAARCRTRCAASARRPARPCS